MNTLLVKIKGMFSFQMGLSAQTLRLIADSCQHLKKLSMFGWRPTICDDDVIHVIKKLGKQLTTLVLGGKALTDVVYLYLNNCARYCDVMSFCFLCSFYVFVKHVCSVRKTPEWPLCVSIASCIIYCGFGVIWQPSYSMCDMM